MEIYKNIYSYEIVLPKNPLKILNCYIIVGDNRNLIVDTGFDMPQGEKALMEAIEELNLDLNKTDLFITHLHADHCGLAGKLKKKGVTLYASQMDGNLVNDAVEGHGWDYFYEHRGWFDLEREGLVLEEHPGYNFSSKETIEFIPVVEGDSFKVGDYLFKVVDVPGHTPGHIALYEEKHKICLCGDHILGKITPNIAFWGFEYGDILQIYFDSLKKIYDYDIHTLFPSHRYLIKDHRERIDELLKHHDNRLNEVLEIVGDKELTVREIAAEMTWDLKYKNWSEFPNAQKWFASGEAMAHIHHLCETNKLSQREENGILYFKRKQLL